MLVGWLASDTMRQIESLIMKKNGLPFRRARRFLRHGGWKCAYCKWGVVMQSGERSTCYVCGAKVVTIELTMGRDAQKEVEIARELGGPKKW